ncbi:MAG: exopolyphosphatase [Spirochaetaceae bacterium]|nr:MAG: exopolyphosphatase [Spirochaetaceae bacterium]
MAEQSERFRLLTRSDFDGLVCAVLLRQLELIGEIKFVHPKDMQDGLIPVSQSDISANLPYAGGVCLAFDHHASELERVGPRHNLIIDPEAPSAARVVYEHYGGRERFATLSERMLEAVDKGDSASFSREEVLQPEGWNLLNFITDARTGLGRFRSFRISTHQLMMDLIDYCTQYTIEEILEISDVSERVELYMSHQRPFEQQLRESAALYGNVLVNDMRRFEKIYAGNRFVKYALFPQVNVAVQVMWGFQRQNTVISIGRSIFDRSSTVNIGSLMLGYRGGGHEATGTCQIDNDAADQALAEIIAQVQDRGNGEAANA